MHLKTSSEKEGTEMNKKFQERVSIGLLSIIGIIVIMRLNQLIPQPYIITTIVSEIVGGLAFLIVFKKGLQFAQSKIIILLVTYMLVSIGFSHLTYTTTFISRTSFLLTQIMIHIITAFTCIALLMNETENTR